MPHPAFLLLETSHTLFGSLLARYSITVKAPAHRRDNPVNSRANGFRLKTTTVRILLVSTKAALQGQEEVNCYQRQIPLDRVLKAISVVVASAISVVIITTCISVSDPELTFISILFESVSAFATVGLSTGITADLSTMGQLFIIITMYIGRVGILLLMSALLGDPSPSVIRYPEEDLLTG